MASMRLIAILATVALAVPATGLTGDWAADLARKAIGNAAREGIGDALKDEAVGAALDAAATGAAMYVDSERRQRYEREEIGESVSTGVEAAMRAADVAEALDDAADVAETLSKVNKIRKVVR